MHVRYTGNAVGAPITLHVENSNFDNSSFCVTSDGNNGNGSYIEEWTCNGSLNQQWLGPINSVG